MTHTRHGTSIPVGVCWLTGLGLAPFAAAAVLAWTMDPAVRPVILDALVFYAAITLACLGALHWGVSLAVPGARVGSVVWAAVLVLLAWLTTQLVVPLALAVLAAGHAGACLHDIRVGTRHPFPSWYVRVRRWSTVAILLALGALLLMM